MERRISTNAGVLGEFMADDTRESGRFVSAGDAGVHGRDPTDDMMKGLSFGLNRVLIQRGHGSETKIYLNND